MATTTLAAAWGVTPELEAHFNPFYNTVPLPQTITPSSTAPIGNKIVPSFDPSKDITPMQRTTRTINMVAIILLAVLAVVLLSVGLGTGNAACMTIGLPVGAALVGGGWGLYHALRDWDLDLPSERNQVIQQLAGCSFDKIVSRYDVDTLIGYDLLRDKIGSLEPAHRARVYGRLESFVHILNQIKICYDRQVSTIENAYYTETMPARVQRDTVVAGANMRESTAHLLADVSHIGDRRRRRSFNGFDAAALGTSVSSSIERGSAHAHYDAATAPARERRHYTLQVARTIRDIMINLVDHLFVS